ncbi:MAG: hypothetical protein HYZ90_02925 [Candidatus Omnitrophica bacterium]|nr:hypothetical protein [Candidatus Omnitrophota bacterium]
MLESAFEELFYYRGLLAALEGRPHRRPRFAVRTFIYRRIFASRWRSAVWKFRRMLWKGIRSVYFGY